MHGNSHIYFYNKSINKILVVLTQIESICNSMVLYSPYLIPKLKFFALVRKILIISHYFRTLLFSDRTPFPSYIVSFVTHITHFQRNLGAFFEKKPL